MGVTLTAAATAVGSMSAGTAIAAAGAAASIGSTISGAINSDAASTASGQQTAAEQQALNQEQGYYNVAAQNLSPYQATGANANNQLATLTGTNPGGNPLTAPLTAQFQPTMAQLENTPGFQFSLNQGLKAAQNNLTAQGLGGSGQAVAGAANYAQGLASTTYNQQLQNYMAQNAQTYNMLNGLNSQGLNASTSLGNIGAGISSQQANTNTQIGNAQAAGTLGSASAISSGISGVTNAATNYANTNALYSLLNQPTTVPGLGPSNPNTL